MVGVVKNRRASAELKICAINLRLSNVAVYRGKVGPWSLDKFREWDGPIEKLYRHVLKCRTGFPTALLYRSVEDGGLGLPCTSDIIQQEKISMLHRVALTDPAGADSVNGLLLRAARLDGKDPGPGQAATISPVSSTLWANSMLEWGKKVGCYLRKGGNDMIGSACEFIRSTHCSIPPSVITVLEELDITQFGDLTTQNGVGNREWLSVRSLRRAGLDSISPIIEGKPVPTGPISLRPGSCWLTSGCLSLGGDTMILEMLGWLDVDNVCVRRWSPSLPGRPTAGSICVIKSCDRSRVAGTDLVVKVSDWLVGDVRRVIMSSDRKAGKGLSRHIERSVMLIYNQGIPVRVEATLSTPSLWDTLLSDIPQPLREADAIDIYTDGSWSEKFGTLDDVFLYGREKAIQATGGLILTTHSDE